jgi:hypothetical protein
MTNWFSVWGLATLREKFRALVAPLHRQLSAKTSLVLLLNNPKEVDFGA